MAESATRASLFKRALGPALIVAAVLATYSNALHGPLVYDDFPSIVDNASIRAPWDWRAVLSPPTDTTVAGRPLANLSFALNHAATGLAVEGMHATNIAIHAVVALLLYWLIRRTLLLSRFSERRSRLVALLATLLWALHPIQTESVTYVVQRVESLAALFMLLTLVSAVLASETGAIGWELAALGSLALGLMTKETAAVTPLIVVLYDRAFLFDSLRSAWQRRKRLYLMLAVAWVPFARMVANLPRGRSAGLHFERFGPWLYLKFQCGALVHYLRLVFWPSGLTFDYGEPGGSVPVPQALADWALPGAFMLVLLIASLWAWRRAPAIGFLGTAFFILLAPSSSVVPVITEVVAEHRMYLPSVLVVLIAVVGLAQRLPAVSVTLCLGAIAALATATHQRNTVYLSPLALWTDTAEKAPQNQRAWVEIGAALTNSGDTAGGDRAYETAIKIDPGDAAANFGLGVSAARRGDCTRAVELYQIALARRANMVVLRFNLGQCLSILGRWREAVDHYAAAAGLASTDAEIHSQYAHALEQVDRLEDAWHEHQAALRLNPDWSVAHFQFANLLIRMGRSDEARAELETAVRQDPAFVVARHRLAMEYAAHGQMTQAIEQLREAVRLDPKRTGALDDLAWFLATAPDPKDRNGEEAVRRASEAIVLLRGKRTHALDVLAAALAEAGRFEEAARMQGEALATAAPGDAAAMQERRDLYLQNQAYRVRTP